ncbi:dynein axonemal intermediate chain 4 [Halyomorpha halys]|uniref:dynein axonemal intermediate chain 4 n=1 Tax=Halyomorpha halys TaxID=286706 RepID=UPI0006D51785|nr:WD repeat-containing protein 78 [Halyomorpha halys]
MVEEIELQKYVNAVKRDVKNKFSMRSKHPTRFIIASSDPRFPYRVIEDGKDVTPLPHYIPGETYLNDQEYIDSCKHIIDLSWEVFNKPDNFEELDSNEDTERIRNAVNGIGLMPRLDVWNHPDKVKEWEEKRRLERIPSMYRLREDPLKKVPDTTTEFPARLVETQMFLLLDVMSDLAPVDSEEANVLMHTNQRIRDRELRNKYIVVETWHVGFSQTKDIFTRNETTQISPPLRANVSVDAYDFDRMVTYVDLGVSDAFPRQTSRLFSIFQIQTTSDNDTRENEEMELQYLQQDNQTPKEMKWLESIEFMKTAEIVERILTANLYSGMQFMYRDRLYSPKPVDDFQYIPQLLWTCSCPRTYGKAVTSISFNTAIQDIFAVSYGKFLFDSKVKNGLVCVWNIKNTEFPERMSILPSPVTFVEFSKKYPRIAGVSFWDGTVGILDMVLREPELIVKCDYILGLLHPIWQIRWFPYRDEEILLTCGENGRLHQFEINRKFRNKKLITVRRAGNTVRKGVEMPQTHTCYEKTSLSPAIMVMAQYPNDEKILFLGTDQGYVQVHTLYQPANPVEIFGAHVGPITTIEFNPVDARIFLTAGCDYYIRLWGYGIYETYLLQLTFRNLYIDYAAWSPVHPYMFVSLSGCYIDVWNLKKKFYEPVTSIENPHKNRNLIVCFSPTGANFLVGDMKGFVYVYGLTSIPKPPEDPLKKLAEAILFPISYDEDRLKLVSLKLGPPYIPEKVKELFSTKKKQFKL